MIFSNHKLIRKNKKVLMWKKVQFSSFSGKRDHIVKFVLEFSIGLLWINIIVECVVDLVAITVQVKDLLKISSMQNFCFKMEEDLVM